jgi:dTDP-4-dehydrorhamnose reductase
MKIAVIGANGQLGTDVVRAFRHSGDDVIALNHSDIELSSIDSVSGTLREIGPNVIVNCAAMHNVDHCESDAHKAFAVNGLGARNLALVTHDIQSILIHISTDYVFDGIKGKPYEESDNPQPLNVYGTSKLTGEYFVRSIAAKHFIVRTSAIYGRSPCRAKKGLNFIELMLKLAKERGEVKVVDTEIITPTSTAELSSQLVSISRSEHYGLYHATAEGSCSWFDFAKNIFDVSGVKVKLSVALPHEFPNKVLRPSYSVLENKELKRNGLNMFRPWQEGVRAYLLQE